MKIAIHVHDMGAAINMGTPVTCKTSVVEIPDDKLPKNAKEFLAEIERNKNGGMQYLHLSFSLFTED